MLLKKLSFSFFLPFLFLPAIYSCSLPDNGEGTRLEAYQNLDKSHASEEGAFPNQLLIGPEKNPDEFTALEQDETVAKEIKDLESLGSWTDLQTIKPPEKVIEYDFPVTINRQVEYYLDFFQNRHRKSFHKWLVRSGRYLPMIQEHLREAGLPLDLAYLPMIESGYSLTAYSRAKAVGPWQFMRATGINYGLTVNNYVDERRDPIQATKAAVKYLSELYSQFGSWHLAVAGYNAGEGKIHRAIKRYKTKDFWKLAQHRYLRTETKRYVPKLIAAIIISKNPEKYGFTDIAYDSALEFETTSVPRWTSLKAVAVACDADFEEIKNLNRQLRKGMTPPEFESYEVKVPIGKAKLVSNNLGRVHISASTSYKNHTIRRGETLSRICRKYKLNKTTLLKANNLTKAKLTPGTRLRIPYQVTKYTLLTEEEFAKHKNFAKATPNLILHTIQPGESVSQISNKYDVTPHMIASWNGLTSIHRIRAGQQLAIYIVPGLQVYSAAPKPTLTSSKSSSIKIIQAASVKRKPTGQLTAQQTTYYRVRGGDSLWEIARKFNLHTSDIKKWNDLNGNTIRPGLKLLLKI